MSQDELVLYVVFDHPKDFPNNFVVRQQIVRMKPDKQPEIVMGDLWVGPKLEMVRALIPPGKVRMDPMEGDDPKICEVWI